jgi:hypothetical protein
MFLVKIASPDVRSLAIWQRCATGTAAVRGRTECSLLIIRLNNALISLIYYTRIDNKANQLLLP